MYTAEQLERELDQTNFPMDRYKPIEKLGAIPGKDGALGSYLCYDEFLEEEVVVKKLGVLDIEQLIPFQREATILCRLRSKTLAQVLDFGATADGGVYVVYEYQAGTGLYDYLCGGETAGNTKPALVLSPALAYRVFIPIAEALSAMHSQGLLHRDIKSSNIRLRNLEAQDAAVYLLDAGSGRVRHATAQAISFEGRTATGDPHYLAPEQLLFQQYDARTEIFAFGCAFFEALTGRPPFHGPEALSHLARRSAPSLTQVAGSVTFNYRLEAFARKCLEKNADARYKSMQEVLYALRELVKNKVAFELSSDTQPQPASADAQSAADRAKARRAKFKSTGNKLKLMAPDDERLDSGPALPTADTDSQAKNGAAPLAEKQLGPKLKVGGGAQNGEVAVSATSPAPTPSSGTSAAGNSTSTSHATQSTSTTNGGIAQVSKPNLKNRLRTYVASLRPIAAWSATSRQGLIAAVIVTGSTLCGWLTFSYLEYLTATRFEEDGIIYGYEPATSDHPGQLTLGVEVFQPGVTLIQDGQERGLLEKHHIVIESPAENLPFIESGRGSSNELNDTTLFERDSVNLNSMNSRSEAEEVIESDLRLGESWTTRFRKQNGVRYLESVRNGSAILINPEMQDVHRTISQMYRSLVAQARNPGNAYSYVTRDWAASTFDSRVTLNSPPHAMPIPRMFPAKDIKLKSFNNVCEVLLRAPAWMTSVGFLRVKLGVENEGWRITEIEPATQAEWQQI